MSYEAAHRAYLESWDGRALLKQHSLSDHGVWEVRGEDSNPDMGGHHHEPLLGLFEGKLEDVIAYATSLPNWMQWGAGGSIKAQHTRKITQVTPEMAQEVRDKQDAAAAEKQLKLAASELEKLQGEADRLQRRIEQLKR